MAAMLMPGPTELVLIILILVALLATGKLRCSRRKSSPCPNCGGWTLPGAGYCHQCGEPVETPLPQGSDRWPSA